MQKNIIFISSNYSSFVKKDIDFLSKNYEVKYPKYNWTNKFLTPFTFLQQLFYLLKNINSATAVFIMFGGYWSFLPCLLGKIYNTPTFIILGGTDCVAFPKLRYGSLQKKVLKQFIKWSYQMATCLLPVHESLVFSPYKYYEESKFKTQGYRSFFPNIKTPYTVIYNGFELENFSLDRTIEKKKDSFITVAAISDFRRFKLKGIDKLIELAVRNPTNSFKVIGMSDAFKSTLKDIPTNVELFPFLDVAEFKHHLFESEFYLQLSISEGFPNALCEGMLCGCIPIGSTVGAVPHIIGDTGFLIESSKSEFIAKKITEIKNIPEAKRKELSQKSRKRIIDNFDIKKREKLFLHAIEEYSNKKSDI